MPINDVTSYIECAERLLLLRRHIRALETKLNLSHIDARIVALQNCDAHTSSISLAQRLLSLFHEEHLSLEILQSLMEFEDDAVQIQVNRLDDTLRLSFITLYQFQLENMLRNLLIALNPFDSPSAFYRIAETVLNTITINDKQDKLRTLNTIALIRNSLHSNGIHTPSNRSSTQIVHRRLKAETTHPPQANLRQQQRLFNRFIRENNEVRPHEGIELQTPASMYEPSTRVLPKELPPLVYPAHFETRLVSKNSGIRWNSQWVGVSHKCAGLHVGLEEVDHGLWEVYLGPLKLGRLLEERLRIEDHLGRLVRRNV